MRRLLLCVLVALPAFAVTHCGSDTTAQGDGGDASYVVHPDGGDSGSLFGEGGAEGGSDGSAPACGYVDVSAFQPTWAQTWRAPAPFGQGRCSTAEINTFMTQCYYTNVNSADACAAKLDAGASLDCFSCLLAPDDAGAGPFVPSADPCGKSPSPNVGGCLANVVGSTCAGQWMTANQCAVLACTDCSFCGGGEDIPDYHHPCVAAGGNSGCDSLRANAACALDASAPQAQTCLMAQMPTTALWDFAALFCGAPITDAGTD